MRSSRERSALLHSYLRAGDCGPAGADAVSQRGAAMADVTGKIQVSIRLPAEVHEAFGRIADALERDRTWVMLRAFRQYLENEGGDVLREAEGLAALDRGEGVDFDEVMDEVDDIIAQTEARQAAAKAG